MAASCEIAAGRSVQPYVMRRRASNFQISFNETRAPRIVEGETPGVAGMNPKQERDEWLMGQVALGKRECLEPLVRRYASPLLTFIRRMVGDAHRSEELFQDVFLAVWNKRTQYQC